ncbi:MAG: hypothetical protein NXH97_12530 [Rhodobacteraceae bacterium]|nr:hypothetical protein [Paracoccaceae bacterium]
MKLLQFLAANVACIVSAGLSWAQTLPKIDPEDLLREFGTHQTTGPFIVRQGEMTSEESERNGTVLRQRSTLFVSLGEWSFVAEVESRRTSTDGAPLSTVCNIVRSDRAGDVVALLALDCVPDVGLLRVGNELFASEDWSPEQRDSSLDVFESLGVLLYMNHEIGSLESPSSFQGNTVSGDVSVDLDVSRMITQIESIRDDYVTLTDDPSTRALTLLGSTEFSFSIRRAGPTGAISHCEITMPTMSGQSHIIRDYYCDGIASYDTVGERETKGTFVGYSGLSQELGAHPFEIGYQQLEIILNTLGSVVPDFYE